MGCAGQVLGDLAQPSVNTHPLLVDDALGDKQTAQIEPYASLVYLLI